MSDWEVDDVERDEHESVGEGEVGSCRRWPDRWDKGRPIVEGEGGDSSLILNFLGLGGQGSLWDLQREQGSLPSHCRGISMRLLVHVHRSVRPGSQVERRMGNTNLGVRTDTTLAWHPDHAGGETFGMERWQRENRFGGEGNGVEEGSCGGERRG